ncbi:MAG: glycosyltransferase, partial [Thermosphaera sp.]
SRSEPFGLVALESMASGTPVAASRVEGLLDVVLDVRSHGPRGTGVLFEPLNPVDLAHAVLILVELVERAYKGDVIGLQVRESCVKRSEEFNWRISALKAIEVYTKLHG